MTVLRMETIKSTIWAAMGVIWDLHLNMLRLTLLNSNQITITQPEMALARKILNREKS